MRIIPIICSCLLCTRCHEKYIKCNTKYITFFSTDSKLKNVLIDRKKYHNRLRFSLEQVSYKEMQKPKPYFCGIFETFNQQPSCAVEMDKRSIFIRLHVSFLPFCTSNVSLKLIIYVCYLYTFEK